MKKILENIFGKSKPNIVKSYDNFHTSLHFLNNQYVAKNDYQANSKIAYSRNVIVYRAINLIASSAASVPWRLHIRKNNKKEELHNHPLLLLLHKPNPLMAGAEFFEHLLAYRMISGDSFIHVIKKSRYPIEMYLLRPDRVKLELSKLGHVNAYIYEIGESKIKYKVDNISGQSNILHLKNFNPLDDYRGLSPLVPAFVSIDQYNESSNWNLSMLKNAARPSGALIMKSQSVSDGYLSNEQLEELRSQFNEVYCSSSNTGKPILLQGGLEWQEMSLSPKDMDFIESKHSNARDIALSLGVPPQLLGIPGDSTYNNYQEARLALWEETIIPLLDRLVDALNNWLVPMFGTDLELSYNIDEISALSSRREKIWSRLETSTFLTINEKRKIIGFSPIEGGDKLCNIKD